MSHNIENKVAEKCERSDLQLEVNQLTYTWTIRAYHLNEGYRGCLMSPPFSSKNSRDPSWCLILNRTSDYFGIFLKMASAVTTQVRGNFKCSLKNKKGEELSSKTRSTIDFENWTTYGFEKFVKKRFIYSLAKHIELKIVCEINYILNQFDDFCDQQGFKQQKEIHMEFTQSFQNILDNEKFSDFTLNVRGEKFRAHKAILSARSKFFAAMFEHKTEENEMNGVVVNDISSEVFREMLTFIYTGNTPNLEEMAMDLLAAADMYALHTLKHICEQSISAHLRIETAVETLILADMHSSEKLKSKAIDFINAHFKEVMKTESWQNLKISRFNHLVDEAYQAMTTKLA